MENKEQKPTDSDTQYSLTKEGTQRCNSAFRPANQYGKRDSLEDLIATYEEMQKYSSVPPAPKKKKKSILTRLVEWIRGY
jgi:hypothetical protein